MRHDRRGSQAGSPTSPDRLPLAVLEASCELLDGGSSLVMFGHAEAVSTFDRPQLTSQPVQCPSRR
jgi:hypothetical protein